MGESWPRSPVQTERSEVCTSNRGQDSPIQTDLAQLIRCLLNGQTRKQRNKNINNFICFPARAQEFSWLSSVTGPRSKRDENWTFQSPALYKLRQWMKTKFFIQAQWKSLWLKQQFMKSDQKCNCNVSNACLCLYRSVISSHSALQSSIDWSQKTLMLNV